MIEKFKAKLQKAQEEFLDLYQSYCSSYVLAIKFLVNGSNNGLVHIIIEAFPKRNNDILPDQPFFREILGNLPYDLQEIEDIITYCFDTFQNNNYILTPVIPYAVYSYFRSNGGVTAQNFINLIEDCVINDDFSIMNNGFGLRIVFFGRNINNVFRSYENPAV